MSPLPLSVKYAQLTLVGCLVVSLTKIYNTPPKDREPFRRFKPLLLRYAPFYRGANKMILRVEDY